MRTYTADQLARGITFAWAYHRKLQRFLHRGYRAGAFGRSGPRPDHRSFVHYVLAAELADELGVPFEEYVEAHFWAEQRSRGCHPQARFLHRRTGFGAAERIAAWRKHQADHAEGAAVASGCDDPAPPRERAAAQERYLAQLCARWQASPDEVLAALGGPDAGVFDRAWLKRHPIWRALETRGHFARHPGPDMAALRRCRERAAPGARP